MVDSWHDGERAIQRKLGYDGAVSQAWTQIEPEMPEQHQTFYTTRLPFIPVTTLDALGRPWSSILAGADGKPGFATSRHPGELTFNAHVWDGDPFARNVAASTSRPALIAGIGIEFSTRRRNKFAGYVEAVEGDESASLRVRSVVNEAIGNCPKYINVRDLVATSDTHPRVVHRRLDLLAEERLPDDVVSFVHGSDTLFLGTYHDAGEPIRSHVGMNQRGGRPGFARVRPSDGRTLVIPDYSGNRFLSSLGNIEATPLAGITFISFVTGAVLYLTGDAHNLVGPAAQHLMPRTNALTTVRVTGYVFVEDALPVRQKPGTHVQRSPYSPPVRLLAEENTSTYFVDDPKKTPVVTLARVQVHSDDLATFTFAPSTPVDVVPGQAAIFDFKSFVGAPSYQHMAYHNPTSVNDDRLRTWTVSGSSRWDPHPSPDGDAGSPSSLALTIRHKPGGAVTTALFAMVRQMVQLRPDLLSDASPLQLTVPLVGVVGDFTLPPASESESAARKWLWAAGGIGVTPFLAMLAGWRDEPVDIVLVLSTREPDVLLPLAVRALARTDDDRGPKARGRLLIHIFSRSSAPSSEPVTMGRMALTVEVTRHEGRASKETLEALNVEDLRERQAYVCGPEGFEQAVLDALKNMGVDSCNIKREAFAY